LNFIFAKLENCLDSAELEGNGFFWFGVCEGIRRGFDVYLQDFAGSLPVYAQ
jgi:hypothetical protein